MAFLHAKSKQTPTSNDCCVLMKFGSQVTNVGATEMG